MKSKNDPRHQQRIKSIQALFAWAINSRNHDQDIDQIIQEMTNIDKLIYEAAPKWPIDQINKVELAILRYAVWELNQHQTPPKVIIDEAIEIGKEFGDLKSSPFINAVLGNIFKKNG